MNAKQKKTADLSISFLMTMLTMILSISLSSSLCAQTRWPDTDVFMGLVADQHKECEIKHAGGKNANGMEGTSRPVQINRYQLINCTPDNSKRIVFGVFAIDSHGVPYQFKNLNSPVGSVIRLDTDAETGELKVISSVWKQQNDDPYCCWQTFHHYIYKLEDDTVVLKDHWDVNSTRNN